MGVPVSKTNANTKSKNHTHSGSCIKPRIIEDIVIVWLDPAISKSDENIQASLDQLRLIINTIEIFTNEDECANFLENLTNEIVFMIVSGAVGKQFVPRIEKMIQVDSIYVFCINKLKHQSWANQHRKVKGLYTQIGYICDELRRDIRKCNKISPSIHVVASSSTTDLNELDRSFMHTQLLKEILLDMEYDKTAKETFINFCRTEYVDNNVMLSVIDEFDRNYDCPSPIWWYTRTCFVYSVLNKALRTQDFEIILRMGFVVRDLHRQIQKLYLQAHEQNLLTVYRGQGMSCVEFDKIKNHQGGLISFNSFLSTSIDRQVSLAFADSARADSDLIGILFQMKIDPSISSAPFVSLDNIGYYSDEEKEILFSMNTIFRIGNIKQLDDRLWKVHLTLSSNNDEQLKLLIEHMRDEIGGETHLQRLGNLMFKMDEFDKAEKVFHQILKTISSNDWKQSLNAHYQLGYINNSRSNLSIAFFHYNKAAAIALAHRPLADQQLFGSYSNMGVILHKQDELDQAMNYFQLAIDVELQAEKPDQLKIAIRQTNMGSVCQQQGNFTEAMRNFKRALSIQHVYLPPRHPTLVTTYKSMASVEYSLKNYSAALSYHDKVLQIQQRSLSPNDPTLAETHNYMAIILEELERYGEAAEHASKATNIARQACGPNRSLIENYEQCHERLLKKLHSS